MEVINRYIFGSHLYGTNHEQSDHDYIVVITDESISTAVQHFVNSTPLEFTNFKTFEYDFKVFDLRHFTMMFENSEQKETNILITESHFKAMIKSNIIWVLELVFSPENMQMHSDKSYIDYYHQNFDVDKLISSSLYEIYYALGKAKALFKHDPYRGRKNIFHSFRFALFCIQLLKTKYINDYSEANCYLDHKKDSYEESDKLKIYNIIDEIKKYKIQQEDVFAKRIIPNWAGEYYQAYDLTKYKNNDVILNRKEIKYMDKIITANGECITKEELIKGAKVSQKYLEVMYFAENVISLRFQSFLPKHIDL